MGLTTGDFSGRMAKVTRVSPPPPPPEFTVTVELTTAEAAILKEAAYFYWILCPGGSQISRDVSSYWHNPVSHLSREQAAKVAQDMYDRLFVNVYDGMEDDN